MDRVIRFGRIQQQQRVPGGRGVEHHEGILAPRHGASEGAKHGDFLRAGRAQIFLQ
jgi:hypothetical protein